MAVQMSPGFGIDITVLSLATLWSLAMPLTQKMAVWNGVGMLVLFVFYLWRVSSQDESEPELAGVARATWVLFPKYAGDWLWVRCSSWRRSPCWRTPSPSPSR